MNKSRLMGPLCLPSKEWLDPLGKHVHLVCHKPYPSHLYVLLQAKHGFLLTLFQFSLFVQQLSKKESVFEIQSNYVSLVALEFTVQTRLVSNGEVCLLLTPSVRMKSVYHHTQHESIYYTGHYSRWENDKKHHNSSMSCPSWILLTCTGFSGSLGIQACSL